MAVCHGEEGKLAPWGLLQFAAPIRPPHHQPSTWLLRREGLHPLTLPGEGRRMLQPGMGKCAGPWTVAKTPTRECFVN